MGRQMESEAGRGRKKIVSICPALHNFAGHEYQYTKTVFGVARKRGRLQRRDGPGLGVIFAHMEV